MSRTDLIAEVFTIIRNGLMVKRETVDVPASTTVKSILEILKQENYIENFKLMEDNKQGRLRVYLKYLGQKPAIRNIQRVSRPGLRIYVKHKKVPTVIRGKGIAIVSTSKGIITDRQARELAIGGEVIGYIW
jgi:small subunit ribosomal protein S8